MACRFLVLLAFSCAIFCNAQARLVRSSSSGAGTAPQTCGLDNTRFYCTVDNMCKPRSERCTGTDVCTDPQTSMEPKCYGTSNAGEYEIQLGHAELGFSGSKKNIFDDIFDNLDLEHQFVTFRGFTYEFGSYGVQILDIIDRQYKYIDGQKLNSDGIETVGRSYCTWEDASMFANRWDDDYSLLFNNCQHFTKAMIYFLTNAASPCNRPSQSRAKRQADISDMQNFIDDILTDCSIVCCENGASSTAVASAWVVTFGISAYSIINSFWF